jgi:hypothetical protein
MTDKFRLFLESLDNDEANELWEWLDGESEAIHEMIEVILSSHNLSKYEGSTMEKIPFDSESPFKGDD